MNSINEVFSKNLTIMLFIFIYFGFQFFSQIWNKSISGIPGTKNYMQNFISSIVLIGLVIYYANPQFDVNKYWTFFLVFTFIIIFIYCYSKKGLDEMSEKDKKLR